MIPYVDIRVFISNVIENDTGKSQYVLLVRVSHILQLISQAFRRVK